MKKKLLVLPILIISLFTLLAFVSFSNPSIKGDHTQVTPKKSHWFVLARKSGREFLYYGVLGDHNNSRLIKIFQVKTGVPGESPTPLPSLLGRKYWLITKKEISAHNLETAPYFLTLDIPVTDTWPYGPVPYEECNGQCDWILPGSFGLHGINGDISKLSKEDPGSSGCVRHKDEDITYLHNILNPKDYEIRYYVEDV